jgi:TrmH family RNA methyltransferase
VQTLTLGKHNSRLAGLRRAIVHGALTQDGLLPIEGPVLIEEARRSGIEIVAVYVRKGFPASSLSVPSGTPVFEMDRAAFRTIQTTETSQGAVALVRPREDDFDSVIQAVNPLVVVLSTVQDPGNAGTILRVAESFYASGCAATAGTVSVHNPKTVRASAGSIFRLPHVWGVDLRQASARLRERGILIVGTSSQALSTIETWDWRKPVAVLIGNEGHGLNGEETGQCDAVLRIPQNPAVESLNAAAAATVILYEAARQRKRG